MRMRFGYLALHIGAAIERTKSQHVRRDALLCGARGRTGQLLFIKLTGAFSGGWRSLELQVLGIFLRMI
ncbi:hypothetical protein R0I01_11745 [Bacillus pumilus]|nr:hypothetical protein R0I01_11745 [Bacillus pumilus]